MVSLRSWRFYILNLCARESCVWLFILKFAQISSWKTRQDWGAAWQVENQFYNLNLSPMQKRTIVLRTPEVPSRNYWVSARSKNQTKWPIEIWTLKQEMETDGDHTTMSHLIGASHWSRIYVSCPLVGKYGWKFVGDYSIWFGFLIMHSRGNSWCPYPF